MWTKWIHPRLWGTQPRFTPWLMPASVFEHSPAVDRPWTTYTQLEPVIQAFYALSIFWLLNIYSPIYGGYVFKVAKAFFA